MKYLEKVFLVLKKVSDGPNGGMSVLETSEASGLPMSSTHRILNELIECDVILKDESNKRYRLSPRLVPLVQGISGKMHLDVIKDVLKELRDMINETVFLSELSEGGVTSIMTVESNRMFSFLAKAGVYLPVSCTAAGLAIVAFIDEGKAQELMCQGYDSNDPNVKVCPIEAFKLRLQKVREDGYAFCDEEYEAGLRAVAVPVFREGNLAVASITVIAPAERLSPGAASDMEIVVKLKEAAERIKEFI